MSSSVAFQTFIVKLLEDDAGVAEIVADRVLDGPEEDTPFPYISMGPSDAEVLDAECIDGKTETLQIDCWSRDQGKLWPCKRLVGAVVKAINSADTDDVELESGSLVAMRVTMERTFIDRDNITAHGVVQVEAELED